MKVNDGASRFRQRNTQRVTKKMLFIVHGDEARKGHAHHFRIHINGGVPMVVFIIFIQNDEAHKEPPPKFRSDDDAGNNGGVPGRAIEKFWLKTRNRQLKRGLDFM